MNNKQIKEALDKGLFNDLYKEFTPVIYSILKRYPSTHREDLLQTAYIALYMFSNDYKKYKPRSWKSYVKSYLNNRLIDEFRKDTGLIHIPHDIMQLIKKIKKKLLVNEDYLLQSVADICEDLKCKPNRLELAKQYKDIVYESLDNYLQEQDSE